VQKSRSLTSAFLATRDIAQRAGKYKRDEEKSGQEWSLENILLFSPGIKEQYCLLRKQGYRIGVSKVI